MSKGRLNITEKYAIQGMLHDKKTVKDIAKVLGRTVKTVQKYADDELDKIHDTVTTVTVEVEKSSDQGEIRQNVYERINAIHGMVEGAGLKLVERAIKENGQPPSADVLFGWAMAQLNAGDIMMRKQVGTKAEDTVVMMTQAASERSDNFAMPEENISRTARNNLFDIKRGKMKGEV